MLNCIPVSFFYFLFLGLRLGLGLGLWSVMGLRLGLGYRVRVRVLGSVVYSTEFCSYIEFSGLLFNSAYSHMMVS